jgi:hypothetical protein
MRSLPHGIVCRPLSDEPLVLETHLCIRKEDCSNLVNAFCRTFLRKHKEMRAEPQLKLPLWESTSAVPLDKYEDRVDHFVTHALTPDLRQPSRRSS